MEVDNVDSVVTTEGDKYANLKAFVTAATEFQASHSDSSVSMMNRYLGLIASSCDLTIFTPGRTEVCAFFGALWRVMCDGRAPHWAGIAVIARASMEPSARHALTHTYKFLPILTRLLSDSISSEKKLKLLTVMQDITFGIKITWQESYLPGLMKQLTDWITCRLTDAHSRAIGHKALTVLVNVCYGNTPAIYALVRAVDTKQFITHLICLKDDAQYGSVVVCRLLLCLSGTTRSATQQSDVHSYLCCTMMTVKRAVHERDENQLLHSYAFVKDLCSDQNLRPYVLAYQRFSNALPDIIQGVNALCDSPMESAGEPDTATGCLSNALKLLTVIINLDIYSLRCHHGDLVRVCVKASRPCLAEALELFAAIVSQYKDNGRLPQEVIDVIVEGLPGLLAPPAIEPSKVGLPWLQLVGALCDSLETQEHVLRDVPPDGLESTLHSVLQYTSQTGTVGVEWAHQAVVLACRCALTMSPQSAAWDATLHRILGHPQVRQQLCAGISSSNPARRKPIIHLVKHYCFPTEHINQIFGDAVPNKGDATESATSNSCVGNVCVVCGDTGRIISPQQEDAITRLIGQLSDALRHNKINDVATSSVMELYGYKISCLEQRIHAHTVALQGASDHMTIQQHTLAMLQATAAQQQDVLYTTQIEKEKYKKMLDNYRKQIEDMEATVRGCRAKIVAERVDKEKLKESLTEEFRREMAGYEKLAKVRENEHAERLKRAEEEYHGLEKKLEQETNKNSELAGVLIKFEERVKQREKKITEASAQEQALRKELEQRDTTIKQLQKTVVERENRLYQVTTQLEEMKRVQEMVTKLMSKSTSSTTA